MAERLLAFRGNQMVVDSPTFAHTEHIVAQLPQRAAPRWRRTRAVMLLGDLVAIVAAGLLAAYAWTWFNAAVDARMFLRLWPMALVMPVGFTLGGLYPAAGVSPV